MRTQVIYMRKCSSASGAAAPAQGRGRAAPATRPVRRPLAPLPSVPLRPRTRQLGAGRGGAAGEILRARAVGYPTHPPQILCTSGHFSRPPPLRAAFAEPLRAEGVWAFSRTVHQGTLAYSAPRTRRRERLWRHWLRGHSVLSVRWRRCACRSSGGNGGNGDGTRIRVLVHRAWLHQCMWG